jgi:dihydrofolate reductase
MEPFARTIDAKKKYVVSSTLDRVDWNAELLRGDLGKAVQQLKRQSGKGLFVGGGPAFPFNGRPFLFNGRPFLFNQKALP